MNLITSTKNSFVRGIGLLESAVSRMSEQIKFILQELNLPPFKLNYNLIVFDQLSGENRLQVGN